MGLVMGCTRRMTGPTEIGKMSGPQILFEGGGNGKFPRAPEGVGTEETTDFEKVVECFGAGYCK